MKKNLTKEQIWWNQLGSAIKLIFQRRHYPATHVDYLTEGMINDIYHKENLTNK